MSDLDALDERLRAVERALTDGDDDLTDLRNAAELARQLDALGERLDDVEARLDELDAATQALRGYVGNVRAVNESVERRADAALAKAESLEADARTDGDAPGPGATGGRGTDGRGTDGRPPDGRATESDPSVSCGCRSRRSEASSATEEQNATSDGDPGLLTRIAEAL
jgi:hypothetical protein